MKLLFGAILAFLLYLPAEAETAPPGGVVAGWGVDPFGGCTGVPVSYASTGIVTVAGQVLTNVVALAAGLSHRLALRSDGTVVGWGSNHFGEATGSPSIADFTNGVVQIDGSNLSNVIAIAAGGGYSLALLKSGKVIEWGDGRDGQTPPKELSDVVAISARGGLSLALKHDGTVVSWGDGYIPPESLPPVRRHDPSFVGLINPKPPASTPPAGLSNVVAIACGGGRGAPNLALQRDGRVVAWGFRSEAPPFSLTNAVAVAAAPVCTMALTKDGTVAGWGDNLFGQATGIRTTNAPFVNSGLVTIAGKVLTNVVAIAAGGGTMAPQGAYGLALTKQGTVISWGKGWLHQTDVPAGLTGVTAIAAGEGFALAITTNSSSLVEPHGQTK